MTRERNCLWRMALLCFALMLLLSGCTPIPTPQQAPGAEPLEKPKDLAGLFRLMVGAGLLPEMSPVPESVVTSAYHINPAWLADSVFMVAKDSLLADEVLLLKARDDDAVQRILPLLKSRLAEKETGAMNPAPEQFATILDGRILHEGLNLALIVSKEADQLVKIYQDNR